MAHDANHSLISAIDPAFVDRIVREVIARLQQTDQNITTTGGTTASIGDKIVTANTITTVTGTPSQIFVAPNAVVTPAAYDAARERGIEISKTTAVPPTQQPQQRTDTNHQEIIDGTKPERAASLAAQLARRGVRTLGTRIVLSDTPAADLYDCITTQACRAAMVATIADVDRFQRELQPDVWVLDMERMNLTTAVNVAARIAFFGN